MKKYRRLFLLIKFSAVFTFFIVAILYMHGLIEQMMVVKATTPILDEVAELYQATNEITPNISQKKIYIYSTHQKEEYNGGNVVEGSYYLKEQLEKFGFKVIVEESDFTAYGALKGLNYNKLYTVSNTFLTEAIVANSGFDLIIDFHRDSVGVNVSRLTTSNSSYAKMMFVIGGLSDNATTVKQASSILSNLINQYVPGISRGILEKQSYFNQSVAKNMLLVEVGGVENEFIEVKNSVEVLSLAIRDYLNT